jgi:thioredoxin 1
MKATSPNNIGKIIRNGIAVVQFTASWCAPCKKLSPILQELENDNPGIKFLTCSIEDYPEVAKEFNMKSIPTVIVFVDGVEVRRLVGLRGKSDYAKALE